MLKICQAIKNIITYGQLRCAGSAIISRGKQGESSEDAHHLLYIAPIEEEKIHKTCSLLSVFANVSCSFSLASAEYRNN
jgi:hypothetical protein